MVIVRIWEGLGNQLFQYAYAKALALRTGQQVALDIRETGSLHNDGNRQKRSCGLKHFRTTLPLCRNVERKYPFLDCSENVKDMLMFLSMKKVLPYKYYQEILPDYKEQLLHMRGDWYLQGYFQNVKYFQDVSAIIRKDLQPRSKIKISKELQGILQMEDTVSVHIRRGDYCKIGNCLPKIFYDNAIIYMKQHIGAPFYVVFSDDMRWVKDNMDLGSNSYYITPELGFQDYEELLIMSKCRHHIISNSTFGWWGAWLGQNTEKVVVGPKRWFDHSGKYRGINIMPDEWIKI